MMALFWIVFFLLLFISLFFVFPKAGVPGWKGLVPGLNIVEWCKIIGRPNWHAALWLVPIVNIFVFTGMAVQLVRSFNKLQFWQSALAVIAAPIYFLYLGLSKKEKYEGPSIELEKDYKQKIENARAKNKTRQLQKLEANNPYSKSVLREWAEAVVFAVFAAAFIRMFLIEAYMIPTSSMEGSLMVGDFLFVSKASYGIRPPQTIAMVPLLHNRIPGLDTESYLENPKLKYRRFPALREIKHNSPVVFNFPAGDSVFVFDHRTWTIQDVRYDALPPRDKQAVQGGRKPLITRPMDKRDHYIKRCVGLPGDSLQIVNRQMMINGKPFEAPSNLQYIYHVSAPNGLNKAKFTEWGISDEDRLKEDKSNGSMLLILNNEQAQHIKQMDPNIVLGPTMEYQVVMPDGYNPQRLMQQYNIDDANYRGNLASNRFFFSLTDAQAQSLYRDTLLSVKNFEPNNIRLFPHAPNMVKNWTVDNFGPIYIPKAGQTVKIDAKSIKFYERIINVYEENDLQIKDGQILINGQVANTYTFKMNYYWMMGDNRHNSEDSRVWGFVPEDHIVGRPLFIWFALREGELGKGINWRRIGGVGRHLE